MNHDEDFELEPQDQGWKDAFRDAIHAESEKPAAFWTAQRAAIRGRISPRGHRKSAWMAFASVAALCIFALLMLSGVRTPSENQQLPQREVAKVVLNDDQVLKQVQETIDNPVPDSFAPIDLLAQDMDKQFKANKKLAKQ